MGRTEKRGSLYRERERERKIEKEKQSGAASHQPWKARTRTTKASASSKSDFIGLQDTSLLSTCVSCCAGHLGNVQPYACIYIDN